MASPVVVVLIGRRGGNGVGLCVDYKYLNKYKKVRRIQQLILTISFTNLVKVDT